MAIAYDNASHSGFLNGTSNNLSHTTSGSDRHLCVYVYASTNNITGASYNGVSMTQVDNLLMTGGAAGQYIYMYTLENPASGANNVTVTSSSGMGGYISAVSYTGAAQTGQPDASNKGGSSSTSSQSVSVTTTVDNCWLVGFAYTGNTMSAGTGTTLRGGSVAGILSAIDSNGVTTPAGSDSLIVTQTASFAGMIVASIAPATGGGATFIPRTSFIM